MSDTTKRGNDQTARTIVRGVAVTLSTLFKILLTLLLIGICTGAIMACFAASYIQTVILPQSYLDLQSIDLSLSTTMYYTDPETGADKELRTLHAGENRILVEYEDIPEDLIHAAIAIEDKRFYDHQGVDWIRTGGAFVNMFLSMRNNFGGSTLTQQLIKNATDNDDVTVKRKIVEIFQALEAERNYSKEEILEMYLNQIYLGQGCYGVGTAAYTYFGKDISELSLAECASLIGITNNPSAYDPYISDYTKENNKDRQELILKQMSDPKVGLNFITEEEAEAAANQTLVFQRGEENSKADVGVYSYYEDEVIRAVTRDLKAELGLSDAMVSQMVYSGGLSIYTCFDPVVQAKVDAVYENPENLPYVSASGQSLQSAVTVVDNETGNWVAISGGIGEKDGSLSLNRADSLRPPGSSIKPIAVYAPALELGVITPATVIDDSPYTIDGGKWPVNSYSGYRGLTTVYQAVQNSVNTVAVKIMGNYITPLISYEFLTQNKDGMGGLGLSTDHIIMGKEINGKIFSDVDIAPLALGGLTYGVNTMEMASAYSTFARSGVYVEGRVYTKVVDADGKVLLDNQPETHVAMKESTAWYINDLLKNAAAYGTGYGSGFNGMTTAGKTGTTSSRKDLWFAGYSPYYTAVVWTGYDQQEKLNSSLKNPSVGLWNKVMSSIHEGFENKDFALPTNQSIVSVQICKDSGLLVSDACKLDPRDNRVMTMKFVNGDQPTQYCTCHELVDVCLDCPFLDETGGTTYTYHLAGEFCPIDRITQVALVNYDKTEAEASVTTTDSLYLKSTYDALGEEAYCNVHTEHPPVEPEGPTLPEVTIDPYDPTTWPDDPLFNPFDPTTWPGYEPETEEEPTPSPDVTPDVTPEPEPTTAP